MALLSGGEGAPEQRAYARFVLARALWVSGQDRSRARQLAKQAERDYQQSENRWAQDDAARVGTWLVRRGGP
ncbi:MAG: hypothetical protein B7733_25160 [Myxococcales bacterium FL481]|nr:MAG: hypothetical protein B7733_25160 [Myxococcales bacterium FL481]